MFLTQSVEVSTTDIGRLRSAGAWNFRFLPLSRRFGVDTMGWTAALGQWGGHSYGVQSVVSVGRGGICGPIHCLVNKPPAIICAQEDGHRFHLKDTTEMSETVIVPLFWDCDVRTTHFLLLPFN